MSTLTPFASAVPTKPLKYVAALRGEKVDSVPTDGEYLGLEQIESGTGRLSDVELQQQPEGAANVFGPGDVLFGKLRPYLAKGWTADRAGYCTTEALVLKPQSAASRFVRYCVLASEFIEAVNGSTYGSKMPRADWSFVGSVQIPCPNRADQERIANFLDVQTARIDALIAEKETLQQRLGEYRLSAITSALSGGLIPYDSLAETGEYWFATVPSHWAFCPLNYRYEVQLGKMLDEKRITGDHLLPYLRNVDVQWGQINTEGLPQMDIHPEEHERYTVRPGDLLVCEGGDVGRAAIWEGTSQVFAFQKALHRVRPRTGNDLPKYLFYLLFDSAKRGRFADREKATIAHLTAEAFRRYRFPFPPREEQEEIVGRLDATMASIDRLLDHVNEHVDRLREYRSSLISAAVTGQLDLSTFKAVA